MYNINTSINVKAPREVVFSVLRDMSNFPKFMHYVKNIDVEKKSDKEVIAKWSIDIEGADVVWEEKDIFDAKNMELIFSKIRGDYNRYYGRWSLENNGDKTRLSIEVNVDWDIPSFEKVIGPILQAKTKRIIRGMLAAIKLRSEKIYSGKEKVIK